MMLSWIMNDCEIEIDMKKSRRTPHNHYLPEVRPTLPIPTRAGY